MIFKLALNLLRSIRLPCPSIISNAILSSLLLLYACLMAAQANTTEPEQAIELWIKPSLCIISKEDELCMDQITINWQANHLQSLCLFQSGTEQPLFCWNDEDNGLFLQEVNTKTNLTFQLRQQGDNSLLASQVFQVLKEYIEYRRRRRNPWNFF